MYTTIHFGHFHYSQATVYSHCLILSISVKFSSARQIFRFFFDKRRIISYDSWIHQHVISLLDYKIVPCKQNNLRRLLSISVNFLSARQISRFKTFLQTKQFKETNKVFPWKHLGKAIRTHGSLYLSSIRSSQQDSLLYT
jgi:hypothetical protein